MGVRTDGLAGIGQMGGCLLFGSCCQGAPFLSSAAPRPWQGGLCWAGEGLLLSSSYPERGVSRSALPAAAHSTLSHVVGWAPFQ